jgi:hypothetical protein
MAPDSLGRLHYLNIELILIMLSIVPLRLVQFLDHVRINGFRTSLNEMFYLHRKAIIIEKDLNGILLDDQTLVKNGLTFAQITHKDSVEEKGRFKFRNRLLKACYYLERGYTGHSLIKDDQIIGDVWYFGQKKDSISPLHEDITLLQLKWDRTYAYSFDTFLDPENRGNNVAKALLNNSLYAMAIEGYRKVYGYYWHDNLPAIWNAKVIIKFKEIRTIEISRFLFLRFSRKDKTAYGKRKDQNIH